MTRSYARERFEILDNLHATPVIRQVEHNFYGASTDLASTQRDVKKSSINGDLWRSPNLQDTARLGELGGSAGAIEQCPSSTNIKLHQTAGKQ